MTQSSPWLVLPPNDVDAEVRLVCFAHAGGAASTFYPWRAGLGEQVAVVGVQLPGREDRLREPLVHSLDEIVEAVSGALLELDRRPVVLFGHSFGAIVAFEVANALQRAAAAPSALLVSGRAAPDLPNRAPRIAHLSAADVLQETAERYGGIPDAVLEDPQLRSLQGRVLQADLEMTERYQHTSDGSLTCPITALGGLDDAWVTRRELDGWQHQTSGAFSCLQFPGGHFYFKAPANETMFLNRIRSACQDALVEANEEG